MKKVGETESIEAIEKRVEAIESIEAIEERMKLLRAEEIKLNKKMKLIKKEELQKKKLIEKEELQKEEEAYLIICKKNRNAIELFLKEVYFNKVKEFIEVLENSGLKDDEKEKFLPVRLDFKDGWIQKFHDAMNKRID